MTRRFGLGLTSLTTVFLTLAVLIAHGWCLNDGSVLDDHWHQKGLREHGWTGSELMRTLEIEPARWMHLWWQTETVRWEYARPLFILAMKTVYVVLGGSDPWSLHAYSLFLHWIAALLVVRLVWRLTEHRGWSIFAGLLFVVYPNAVMTVQWPSAQNVVQQTVLTLAALLCYLRATDWRLAGNLSAQIAGMHAGWLALTLFWWILALFTRENALVLPAIFAAFEYCFRGWPGLRRRLGTFVGFGVLCAIFVAWRVSVVTQGMPDVYIRRPDGDLSEYLAWCGAKLLHYIVTSVWLAPMTIGPTGRYNPWTEASGDCVLMVAILAAVTGVYLIATRGVRGRWIWPLWIVLSVLPVIPVVATPHSGYLGGVGFVVAVALAASAVEARRRRRVHWAGAIAVFYLVTMSVLTMLYRWQWSGIIAAERMLPAAVALDPPPSAARDVFFLNLPFVNVYNKPHLVEALGGDFDERRVHVLTFSPQPVMIEQRVTIEQTSEFAFDVSVAGQPFFSRLLGRFLLDGFAKRGQFRPDERFENQHFTATILEADDAGVWKLRFRFPRPLADSSYAFYLSSIDFPAARIRFRKPGGSYGESRVNEIIDAAMEPVGGSALDDLIRRVESGETSAMTVLFATAERGGPEDAAKAVAAVRRIAGAVAQATGAPVAGRLLGPPQPIEELAPPPRIRPPRSPPPPPELNTVDWAQVRNWWHTSVDDALVRAVWTSRGELAPLVKDREEVPHARQWAGMLIRTDLYLTGVPFDDPRPARPSSVSDR
ncbi:MAG: hypothetical protein IT450_11255 [Phycisphaerales bacterium]|nr:hypothetical protein [Phycisphaerales bacterium]